MTHPDENIKLNDKKESLDHIINSCAKKKQTNINRCMRCNKKLGLLGIKCKCDLYFCSDHRYSDRHNCSFDYKKHGKELLTKNNPVISFSKIQNI